MNKKILIAGLVSSIAMAMIEMVYEGLFGVGFWSAPIFIAATILRDLQAAAGKRGAVRVNGGVNGEPSVISHIFIV